MISIPVPIYQDMIAHAQELDPHECCGILAGLEGKISKHYRITNILAKMTEEELARFDQEKLSDLKQLSPEERADIAFQMDAMEMAQAQKDIRQKNIVLQAFYHSHTCSPARPSVTDIKIAMEFESYRAKLNIPEPYHLIISLENKSQPVIRGYQIRDSKAIEIPISCP